MSEQSVLLVGGTGRTGQCVLKQLLGRGTNVHIIVRSAKKLSQIDIDNKNLTVTEANLLSLTDEDLQRYVSGCDAVISCLGHVLSFRGIYGQPRDLVSRATKRLCQTVEKLQPAKPVKFILMSSVSVNNPGGLDTRRKTFEKVFMWMICGLLPPAKDNQKASDFLYKDIGMTNQFVQWTAVRPDTLLEGDVSEYTLHENLVNSIFAPASTNIANVAHFMCELVTNPKTWNNWKGKLPVIINAAGLSQTLPIKKRPSPKKY